MNIRLELDDNRVEVLAPNTTFHAISVNGRTVQTFGDEQDARRWRRQHPTNVRLVEITTLVIARDLTDE